MKIAVIGAGMAGATCARQLADQGMDVTVFDKGRGVGGRLAQRRRNGAFFDHGGQYFTARDKGFQQQVEAWRREGLVDRWPVSHKTDEPTWIGVPAMSQPVKAMLAGIEVKTGLRVQALSQMQDGWHLDFSDASAGGPFDAVGIAVPQPQAIELLATVDQAASLRSRIEPALMAPCWTAMLAFEAPLACDLASGPVDHPVIHWVTRNTTKKGRQGLDAWTLNAGHAWSRDNLERQPAEVLPDLRQAFEELAGQTLVDVAYADCHRWRFAFVERALGEPAIGLQGGQLAVMGDWCLGPRIEAAYLSGKAGAAMLAKA